MLFIFGNIGSKLLVSSDQNTFDLGSDIVFSGISSDALGATGFITGMIIAVLSIEIFCVLGKVGALKIKMPETVPPGVARVLRI